MRCYVCRYAGSNVSQCLSLLNLKLSPESAIFKALHCGMWYQACLKLISLSQFHESEGKSFLPLFFIIWKVSLVLFVNTQIAVVSWDHSWKDVQKSINYFSLVATVLFPYLSSQSLPKWLLEPGSLIPVWIPWSEHRGLNTVVWTLGSEHWGQNSGIWIPGYEHWDLNTGVWTPGSECWGFNPGVSTLCSEHQSLNTRV